MALLDTLNKIRNRKQVAQPAGISGELAAQQRQAQVGAKQAVGPGVSSLGAQRQQAVGQTQQQLQQVGANIQADQIQRGAEQVQQGQDTQRVQQQQQFTQAMAGLGAQAQIGAGKRQARAGEAQDKLTSQNRLTTEQITNQYQMAIDKMAADTGIQRENMFQSFQNSNKELEDRKDAVELEQVAFMYAMEDKSYVDQIDAIGKKHQLENDIEFKQTLQDVSLGTDLANVLAQSALNIELATSDAELAKELAKMDINTALQIVRAAAQQSATESIISGTGKLAKSGVEAYKG